MRQLLCVLFLFAISCQAQVLDVNGDGKVGVQEALALSEDWRGEAKAINDHNHLYQTWIGDGKPLKIKGSFRESIYNPPKDPNDKAVLPPMSTPSAPLVLENQSASGYGLKVISECNGIRVSSDGPDLLMMGDRAVISATDDDYENLGIFSNNNVYLYLDYNRDDPHTSGLYIMGRSGYSVLELSETGDMWIRGNITEAGLKTTIDHPLDPANKTLSHSAVSSPEMKTVYDGVATLDDKGEAWIQLPDYFEAFNKDFRYQLTCIGAFAPVYIASKIENNRFQISGGKPGLEVSWQVTGIRQDAFAKSSPLVVEEEKLGDNKGQILHSEFDNQP